MFRALIMSTSKNLAGAACPGLFFRVGLLFCKTELRLAGSLVLGILLSLLMAWVTPMVRLNWQLVAHVDGCNRSIDRVIQLWNEKQRRSDVDATASGSFAALPDSIEKNDDQIFRFSYRDLSLPAYISIWAFPDSEYPFPETLLKACRPKSFDFGEPTASAPAALLIVWMAGWYLAIAVIVSIATRRQWLKWADIFRVNVARVGYLFRYVSLGVLTALATIAITTFLQLLYIHFQIPQVAQLLSAVQNNLWVLVLAVIIGPFCEELLFRRWLFQSFIDASLTKFGAVVVSASFAGIHMLGVAWSFSNAIYGALVFGLSLVLCCIYVRSRSILASSVTHAAHNVVVIAVALMSV